MNSENCLLIHNAISSIPSHPPSWQAANMTSEALTILPLGSPAPQDTATPTLAQ